MKIRKISALLLTMGFALAFMTTAYAGEWKKGNNNRWWYENDDGSYTTNGWQTIDGAYYYFDSEGYMLADTVTPDGYKVGPDGAWIQEAGPGTAQEAAGQTAADAGQAAPDAGQAAAGQTGSIHSVSNITFGSGSVTDALTISDWSYTPEYSKSTYHIFEITNNSDKTLKISINESAKNNSGQVIGAASTDQEDIPAGCTVFVENFFYEVTGVYSYDTTITTKAETLYVPVIQDIDVVVTDLDDKALVTVSNRGSLAAEFVKADVVFFDNGQVAYHASKFFKEDEYYILPGSTLSEQVNPWGTFYTEIRAHVTGRRSKYDTK